MLRVTRWSPDTCGCVLEYEWDDTIPQEQRVHKFSKAINLCTYHKALAGKAYDAVVAENTSKNIVFGKAQEIKPSLTVEDYTWSFDDKRKLKVGFLGKLTAAEKAQLKTTIDSELGVDKVEVI